jgi:hypothetical protein
VRNALRCLALSALAALLPAGGAHAAQLTKPCELMKMLASGNAATVQKGIQGFLDMGANAGAPLICYIAGKAAAAAHPTEAGKAQAEKALVKLGKVAVPAILRFLPRESEDVRARLVRVLAQIRDDRRVEPLLRLWQSERADRVRAALVSALVSIQGSRAVAQLRARIPSAGMLERTALAAQLALRGTANDLRQVLQKVPAGQRAAFLARAAQQVRALGGPAAAEATKRLKSLVAHHQRG